MDQGLKRMKTRGGQMTENSEGESQGMCQTGDVITHPKDSH